MSETTPRHRHIVNIDDVPPNERLTGTRFGFKNRILGERAGGRQIGGSWYEIPPGRAAFPYHFHCVNEEAMFVLEGEGQVRIGPDTAAIRAGDWVSFPIGPDSAHQVINTGAGPLRLLALSTKINADVVGYPDSKKLAARGMPPGAKFGETPWIQVIVREGTNVEYFDGEKLE
jgi:uncharacterized cupin superfamily protein